MMRREIPRENLMRMKSDIAQNHCAGLCGYDISLPSQSLFLGFRGVEVPREVFPGIALDDRFGEDVDPQMSAVRDSTLKILSPSLSSPTELSLAEKFRLAFVERDTRLAPKASQERKAALRAEREWRMTNTEAKAIALAAKASKFLQIRNQLLL